MTTKFATAGSYFDRVAPTPPGDRGHGIEPPSSKTISISTRPLSQREREVLALVAEGNSNKMISAHLVISDRTVKNHLTNIMTKLRAYDRTHAVVTAIRIGWLSI